MTISLQPLINPDVEAEARRLRDAIYGPSTDESWQACRQAWCRPDSVKWLKEFQWPVLKPEN